MAHDLFHRVKEWAEKAPQKVAFHCASEDVTYSMLITLMGGIQAKIPADCKSIGILGPSSPHWVAALLAAEGLGLRVVPLPEFFSPGQLMHIIGDAEVDFILHDPCIAPIEGIASHAWQAERCEDVTFRKGATQIVYTSGSSGTPKGVIHPVSHLDAKAYTLAQTSQADENDTHLSVLPFSILLEQIAGIRVALSIGATVHVAPQLFPACMKGDFASLSEMAHQLNPSTTVLVPELLRGWVGTLMLQKAQAPASLRYVAVGGAHVPDGLAESAWAQGVPVYEGYGLSECASVVSVNSPENRKAGTVGKVLPDCNVSIQNGEIVVQGDCVMEGYLHQGKTDTVWHTGDLGSIDEDGYLQVFGRKDNVIVTSMGRNITPEWLEKMVLADWRIARCFIVAEKNPFVSALVIPHPHYKEAFKDAEESRRIVRTLCQAAPDYALPQQTIVTDMETLVGLDMLTANGRPKRKKIASHFDL